MSPGVTESLRGHAASCDTSARAGNKRDGQISRASCALSAMLIDVCRNSKHLTSNRISERTGDIRLF